MCKIHENYNIHIEYQSNISKSITFQDPLRLNFDYDIISTLKNKEGRKPLTQRAHLLKKVLTLLLFIIGVSVLSFAGMLHIIAGNISSKLGGSTMTISSAKIVIGDTTIIATTIVVSGKKSANGGVNWTSADAIGNVTVILKDATATAKGMHYNLKTDSGTFDEDVFMTIAASKGNITIQASKMNFDTKTDLYTGQGSPVIIKKGETHIEGKLFTYNGEKKTFIVEKDVYLYNTKNKQKAWADELMMNTADNSISLKHVKMEITLGS